MQRLMNFAHYRVFADTPGGGKHIAIARGASAGADWQTEARNSGAPLTGLVTQMEGQEVWARFFTPTGEKGESDSGALVIAEHLARQGLDRQPYTVHMAGEAMTVVPTPEGWGSAQPDTRVAGEVDPAPLLAALGLSTALLDSQHPVLACGAERLNVVLPLRDSDAVDSVRPDLEQVQAFNEATGTGGVIVCTLNSLRASHVDLRFFAPRRGLAEDNAGSYTLATLCAYIAARRPDLSELVATQGYGMHKPSRLHARFARENGRASGIIVSGAVSVPATPPEVQA